MYSLQKCPVDQMDPVQIAARHTYVLNQWSLEDWPVEPLGGCDVMCHVTYAMYTRSPPPPQMVQSVRVVEWTMGGCPLEPSLIQ